MFRGKIKSQTRDANTPWFHVFNSTLVDIKVINDRLFMKKSLIDSFLGGNGLPTSCKVLVCVEVAGLVLMIRELCGFEKEPEDAVEIREELAVDV